MKNLEEQKPEHVDFEILLLAYQKLKEDLNKANLKIHELESKLMIKERKRNYGK